jgi:hypothetical protein
MAAVVRARATRGASADGPARPGRGGPAALAALCLVYVAIATLPAARGSDLVLATAGGSPDWLLGPLRFAGARGADGPLAGPLLYAGLWIALALSAVVVWRRAEIAPRLAIGAVVALHALFLLAPPLLSQDVFSYVAYARLGVEHDLNPYGHAPADIPHDPVHPFAGSKDAVSVYGPAFTLLTYPLAPLGVPGAFWVLKALAALASLGVVALVWRGARLLGRDPLGPALLVGLNPHVLAHVVAGAHNEALVVLISTAGVLAFLAGRERAGAAGATAAVAVKASAALVVPFLVLGGAGRRRVAGAGERLRGAAGPALAAAAVAAGIGLLALGAFGSQALDALDLLSSNQARTSRWSFPYKTAELLGALLPGDRLDYRDAVRSAYGLAFAALAAWLLWRTWRGGDPVRLAGWATLAVLVASAWLVPWYALWLLPLAALSGDRRLVLATLALCAWMLPIAVPL